MQFREDLPDCQAADAVRSRIDWKYALGVEQLRQYWVYQYFATSIAIANASLYIKN